MRHDTCLYCRHPEGGDPEVLALIRIFESVGPLTHHHHTVKCDACGSWWFDDLVTGGLGLPVPSRRDTVLCDCEDGLPQYAKSALLVPIPEEVCACDKTQAERFSLPIRLGDAPGGAS